MADQDKQRVEAGVASEKDNRKLDHSVEGVTTRDDSGDLGVPMLAGDPSEPQGPEDALGPGSKRGDYAQRIGGSQHFEAVAAEDAGELVTDKDGNVLDVKPTSRLVHQNPRVADVGDDKGKKGGVTTA